MQRLIQDFENPKDVHYRAAHVYFTEGIRGNSSLSVILTLTLSSSEMLLSCWCCNQQTKTVLLLAVVAIPVAVLAVVVPLVAVVSVAVVLVLMEMMEMVVMAMVIQVVWSIAVHDDNGDDDDSHGCIGNVDNDEGNGCGGSGSTTSVSPVISSLLYMVGSNSPYLRFLHGRGLF